MLKAQHAGVQGLAAELFKGGACGLGEVSGRGLIAGAIKRIAEDRVADVGHVDADLVGAPGLQPAADQADLGRWRTGRESFGHFIVGDGAAGRLGLGHRHLLAVGGVAGDRLIDGGAAPVRFAPGQGVIGALQPAVAAMGGKLGTQRAVGRVGLGDDQQAGCVLVEPMDDAGPPDAGDAGQAFTAMGKDAVDQGARPVARPGVDDQAGRFVDDQYLAVFKHDVELHRFAFRFGLPGRRQPGGDFITAFDPVFCLHYGPPVDRHVAGGNQVLKPGPADVGELAGQRAIEPVTCFGGQ